MEIFHTYINKLNEPLWNYLIIILILTGVFFTVTTKFVQFRLFAQSIREMKTGRRNGDSEHGITPFQAFVTGLASRVGVGNIAGVAIAISLGGPGAVFWMWLTALLGMSSAFAESSLAQLFKVRDERSNQFRGGPACYIVYGLRQKWMAILFALSLILAYGFIFNSVQANSIVEAGNKAWSWSSADFYIGPIYVSFVGLFLAIMTGVSIFGGIKRIAKIAEAIVPIMALLYLLMAIYVIVININIVPEMITLIMREAFNFQSASGGFLGALISQAMMLGIKRGLFSNEAGMGSAPNAAAASDVEHPVNQGLIQMLGVFVDTMVVCTCTAVIILLSGVYENSGLNGVQLTQAALEHYVGSWGVDFLALLLFLFAFTTIIGNYAYAESNVQYLRNKPKVIFIFRLAVLMMVYIGSISKVSLVWDMADLSMGMMALINLIAIVLLSPLVWLLLNDYISQLKSGKKHPKFNINLYPEIQDRVRTDIWKR